MKQGKFTLRKLSQLWGENSQSLNTQIPDLPEGNYTPDYPTLAEYRSDDATVEAAIDDAKDTWINVAGVNGDTGETEITRTTQQKIPINVWGDLLLNGRKVITSDQYVETAYFNSLRLNDALFTTLNPKEDLMEGEFAFTSDGADDIFLNLGGSPAHIVRFLRSDSHIRYENVEDIVVREVNWIQAATPMTNLQEGRLWWDTSTKKLFRYAYEDNAFHQVYYPGEAANNNVEKSSLSGDGKPRMNVLYVYAEVTGSPEIKTPKSIYYYDGTDLVELGGSGLGVLIANSSTSSSTAAKVATITGATPSPSSYADLQDQTVRIYFSSGNTYRGNAMTININSLGAIAARCSGDLSKSVVDNQTAGGYMEGVVTYYSPDSAYVFAIDAPQVLNTSSTATYYPMLKSQAGSATTPNTFILQDSNVSVTGSVLKTKGYAFATSPVTITTNSTSSLVSDKNEVIIGNNYYETKGSRRIDVNVTASTSQSVITLFTVPAGYVAISTNGTPVIRNYVGMAWYRSTQVGNDYAGQTFNIKYYDTAGTQQTESLAGADITCPYNDSVAFKIGVVMGPGAVSANLSSSTNKGQVVFYGSFILIPDGTQTE